MSEVEKRLGELADAINAEHRAFVGTFRKTVEHGIRAGELLADAKAQCPHGTWLKWLAQHFEGSARTAQVYIQLYNHRDEVRANTQDSAHFSVSGALREIAAPHEREPFFEVLEYLEREASRLAQTPVLSWDTDPGALSFDDPWLVELTRKIRASEVRWAEARRGAGEEHGKALERVRAMADERFGEEGRSLANYYLREGLLCLALEFGYGEPYRLMLREARCRLIEAVADTAFRERVAKPLNEGTVTIDLADEEAAILRALDAKLLQEVQEAWEECKHYELALRKMETFVRPCDVLGREAEWLKESLSEAQMQMTFASLRSAGDQVR